MRNKDGSLKLWRGDSSSLLKEVSSESIDLVVTSPPYDDLRTYDDSLDWSFEVFQKIVIELKRTLKKGGVVVWVVNDKTFKGSESGSSFKQALYFKDLGFNLHDTMIWRKDSSSFPDKTRYYSVFEYMFIFSKGRPKTFNPIKDRKNKWAGLKRIHREYDKRGSEVKIRDGSEYEIAEYGVRYNVWDCAVGAGKMGYSGKDHPAIFPLKLAKDHVISWSNPGQTVIDPFMGSGTTGVACKELGRNFIGIEKNSEYFEIAKRRLK